MGNLIKVSIELLPILIMIIAFMGRFRGKIKEENKKNVKFDNQKSALDLFWETVTEKDDDTETKINKRIEDSKNTTVNNDLIVEDQDLLYSEFSKSELEDYENVLYENDKKYYDDRHLERADYLNKELENHLLSEDKEDISSESISIDLEEDILKGIIMSQILEEPKSRKYFDQSFPN